MLVMDLNELKRSGIEAGMAILLEKIESIRKELDQLQESAESETKSSMGDKYETAREMVQLERNKLGIQLDQLSNQVAILKSIPLNTTISQAALGAYIRTDRGDYLLSTGLGKVDVGQSMILLSAGAPLGQAMLGLGKGDQFTFGTNTYKILNIT